MRHKVGGYKLKRDESARRSLLRGLVTAVINEELIITTVTKATAAKPLVEKMITLGKKGTLAHRREAAAFLVGAETAMLELVDAKLVKRAADRAKRREEKLKAMQEGQEPQA